MIIVEANQLQKYKGHQIKQKMTNYTILKQMKLFYIPQELELTQEASVGIEKASQKAYNNQLQRKSYQILEDSWKNCIKFYLTEKTSGESQHWKVTQWMESINGKEKDDSFNNRMEEKQPSTTQKIGKPAPIARKHNFNVKKQ
ncbi:hypothetical protein O181_109122 [Austropuccinia psidii MF-1]|uniref:Uncharacterized protein n=1 Tax=Austropuccinia psidii MF-1 TaxID=1389203 RepID=A0A9Q3PR40_9BASI|nr:hypothetical protein [Austropuccinia psidii MF-1]